MGDPSAPSVFVSLNRFGEVVDHLTLHFLKSRTSAQSRHEDRVVYTKKKEEENKLQEFVKIHNPHVILLAASGVECRHFKRELENCLSLGTGAVKVEFVDPEVGKIYANSERGQLEFKEYSPLQREAISNGRRVLDPLAEIAGLWHQDSLNNRFEILSLRLDKLQDQVPSNLLLEGLRRTFVQITCDTGVDLNKIASRPFLMAPLQFVAGLGKKKAKVVMDIVKRRGFLAARKHLLKKTDTVEPKEEDAEPEEKTPLGLGPVVYKNCVGFLRVRRSFESEDARSAQYDLRDNTRIHPESYKLAEQMVLDALEKSLSDDEGAEQEEEDREEEKHQKLQKLLKDLTSPDNLSKLEELDLDLFADLEEKDGKGKKKQTLYQIKAEIKKPFFPLHLQEFKGPERKELFHLLTGESDNTLGKGQLVTVTVQRIAADGVWCKLDSGLQGFLAIQDLSDNPPPEYLDRKQQPSRGTPDRETYDQKMREWLEKKVGEGQTITCRILDVRYDKFLIDLVSKTSELKRDPSQSLDTKLDEYMFDDPEEDKKMIESTEPPKEVKRFIPRSIVHPLFKNFTKDEAQKHLEDKSPGELVIRPSTKGTEHLTITWKVYDDIYFHIDVHELDKPNAQALGAVLMIQNYGQNTRFEDLDEIIARFVDPMVRYSKDIIAAQVFRFGEEKDIDELLQDEKNQNKNKNIPYFLSFSKTPGLFVFSYLPHTKIHREYFSVTPQGYLHNSKPPQTLKTPRKLLDYFKRYLLRQEKRRSHHQQPRYHSSRESRHQHHPYQRPGQHVRSSHHSRLSTSHEM